MGNVLTESRTLKCAAPPPGPPTAPHGGTLQARGAPRLRIEGARVLTRPSVQAASITGCGDTNTNAGQVPCSAVKSVTGTATKLLVDGQPVVLDSVGGETLGSPAGTIVATAAGPSRLRAV